MCKCEVSGFDVVKPRDGIWIVLQQCGNPNHWLLNCDIAETQLATESEAQSIADKYNELEGV